MSFSSVKIALLSDFETIMDWAKIMLSGLQPFGSKVGGFNIAIHYLQTGSFYRQKVCLKQKQNKKLCITTGNRELELSVW